MISYQKAYALVWPFIASLIFECCYGGWLDACNNHHIDASDYTPKAGHFDGTNFCNKVAEGPNLVSLVAFWLPHVSYMQLNLTWFLVLSSCLIHYYCYTYHQLVSSLYRHARFACQLCFQLQLQLPRQYVLSTFINYMKLSYKETTHKSKNLVDHLKLLHRQPLCAQKLPIFATCIEN